LTGTDRPRQLQPRRIPPYRSHRRTRHGRRRHRIRLLRKTLAVVAAIALVVACGIVARHHAPTKNTALTHFDAIIVLGSPANSDGNPTPEQLSRVTEGVHEYERGVAPRLILTGGAVRSSFVEAHVMARSAQAQGIPESSIFIEPEAGDTIQNACYSLRIMKAHGWSSAEVISSAAHVPRVGMILSHLPLVWRIHTAQPNTPQSVFSADTDALIESLKTVHYLVWSRWAEHCAP
jgi:uncharacterized SAM-binding protein YcdF (DUF218 family)